MPEVPGTGLGGGGLGAHNYHFPHVDRDSFEDPELYCLPGPSQKAPTQGISQVAGYSAVGYKKPSSNWGGGHGSNFLS